MDYPADELAHTLMDGEPVLARVIGEDGTEMDPVIIDEGEWSLRDESF